MLRQENWGDKSLLVGDLQVLGKVTGPGVKKIISDIDAVSHQVKAFSNEFHDYWTDISRDNIVTPEEKKILKREFQNISNSYSGLYTQAAAQNLQNTSYFLQYTEVFNELRSYLNDTLNLFYSMSEVTELGAGGTETFNLHFSDYYYTEKFTQIALATGIMGNLGFRTLTSLDEDGNEGDIGLYRGKIYQYVIVEGNGVWEAVGLEGYKGTLTSLPDAGQNQYFMAEDDFTASLPLWVNNTPLYVNGTPFYITFLFEKGFIYVYSNDQWIKIADTTDYRYVVALVDYINVTGELPGAFQEAIDNAIEELDQRLTASIEDEVRERQGQITHINGRILDIKQDILQNVADIKELDGITVKHLPFYFGKRESDPQNAIDTDFYVYSGTTTVSRIKGDVYVKNNDIWNHVDPTSGNQANAMYSIALEDILSLGNSNAYTSLFAGAFFSNTAVITALTTRTIRIQTGGSIQSDIYAANTRGFKFDTGGNIDANGNTHIGGTFSVNGNTTISGNASFDGTVRARTLYLGDSQDAADLASKSYVNTKVSGLASEDYVDGKVEKTVVESHIVYYQDSGAFVSRFFPSPDKWVEDTTGNDDTYTLIQPPYSTTVEKTCYTITQYKLADGTIECESKYMELDRARQRLWAQTEGKTVISGGYIGTNLVHAKSIEAGSISADKIEAGAITSEKLEADIVIGEDATFSGTLSAAKGTFSGELSAATGTFSGAMNASGINIDQLKAGDQRCFPLITKVPSSIMFTPTVNAWKPYTLEIEAYRQIAGKGQLRYKSLTSIDFELNHAEIKDVVLSIETYIKPGSSAKTNVLNVQIPDYRNINYSRDIPLDDFAYAIGIKYRLTLQARITQTSATISPIFKGASQEGVYFSELNSILRFLGDYKINTWIDN